jgi:hypothetical protein
MGSKTRRTKKGARRRRWRWKRWVLGVPVGLVLPFVVLVRLSTWLYGTQQLGGWVSVLAALVASVVLLTIVVLIVGRRLGFKIGIRVIRLTGVLLTAYCVYLLLFVSAANVKSEEVRDTYSSLHPVLRIAVSTFVVMDREAVITDAQRTPEDYGNMGLSAPNTSLHFKQADDFVHAIDLRTIGRSETVNSLTEWYFKLMGFSTLRHTGTADHLHVSLQSA